MKLKLTREQKVAHRFLRAFDMVDDRLSSSLIALEKAESAQSSITSSLDGMSLSGSNNDKMCSALVRIEQSIDDIEKHSGEFANQFIEIENFISEVQRKDVSAGKTLRAIYIHGASVKDVSDSEDMACSKKTVYEYLKRGLDISFDLLSQESD